jgi:hypothetical protein
MRETRLVCTEAHMGCEVGDTGTYRGDGADYVPGLDAGRYTVWPDRFPEASPYNHNAVSYWSRDEMFASWQPVREAVAA